jgi:hypothetical protein
MLGCDLVDPTFHDGALDLDREATGATDQMMMMRIAATESIQGFAFARKQCVGNA